jgi:hypothetical protein
MSTAKVSPSVSSENNYNAILDQSNFHVIKEYYNRDDNYFRKNIDRQFLKFSLESDKYNNIKIEFNKLEESLFQNLFKQINLYIEEIERLNIKIKEKEEVERIHKVTIEELKKNNLNDKEVISLKASLRNLEKKLSDSHTIEEKWKKECESNRRQLIFYKEMVKGDFAKSRKGKRTISSETIEFEDEVIECQSFKKKKDNEKTAEIQITNLSKSVQFSSPLNNNRQKRQLSYTSTQFRSPGIAITLNSNQNKHEFPNSDKKNTNNLTRLKANSTTQLNNQKEILLDELGAILIENLNYEIELLQQQENFLNGLKNDKKEVASRKITDSPNIVKQRLSVISPVKKNQLLSTKKLSRSPSANLTGNSKGKLKSLLPIFNMENELIQNNDT